MLVILIILVAALLAAWTYKENFLTKRPPGPFRLPVLGTLLQLGVDKNRPQFQTFRSLSKKYGPITSIKIGLFDGVIFDDFETIKKLLNHELWVDRFWNGLFAERSFGKPLGIIFIDGDNWKEMRRFTMRTLRDFGYGKQKSMESVLEDEVKDLLVKIDRLREESESSPKKEVDMKHIFTLPVLNVLWTLVCSVRSSDDDQKLQHLLHLVDSLSRATPMGGGILIPFPFLRHVPIISKLTGNAKLREMNGELQDYFWSVLHARREEGVYKSDQRDYIDVFLKEIDRHNEIGSNPNFYTDEQFVTTTIDLFEAGAETTNNTLEFCFYYILQNPSVQAKMQEEIDRVVGRSRLPTIADKAEMPYTEAVITEVQRLANVLPMTVRSPTEDTWVDGFYMPKGVVGFMNIYSVHLDEKFWGDPERFRPERFLTEDGNLNPKKLQRVIPFGAGRRVCLGEALARATLFTYLTSLLQSFNFEKVDTVGAESENAHVLGFTLTPPLFSARISKRS